MSKKILVVDDDHGILEVIQIILESENYSVLTVDDGGNIYNAVEAYAPDLILLDIWMGGADGSQIAKKLKSDNKTKKIPIIMISAKNDTDAVAQLAKADDFISKPFDMDDLLEKVKKHAGK